MTAIKNVAIIGAAGALGEPVLSALINSGKFNITVLIRSSTKTTFPSSVKTTTVDYDSVESLTAALRGQDAVVSTVGNSGFLGQKLVIDAAIAAGVKRFLPSEFGCDLSNPLVQALPVFANKVDVLQYLLNAASSHPSFTYTLVRTNGFLDWGLQHNFLLDLQSRKPRIFDGGDNEFSVITLKSIGQAVVGVLEHEEETRNKAVLVQDLVVSQNKLVEIARRVAPEKVAKWERAETSLESLKNAADDAVKKGKVTQQVMVDSLFVAIMGKGYGGLFERTDNKLLGLNGKTEGDVEEIMRELLK